MGVVLRTAFLALALARLAGAQPKALPLTEVPVRTPGGHTLAFFISLSLFVENPFRRIWQPLDGGEPIIELVERRNVRPVPRRGLLGGDELRELLARAAAVLVGRPSVERDARPARELDRRVVEHLFPLRRELEPRERSLGVRNCAASSGLTISESGTPSRTIFPLTTVPVATCIAQMVLRNAKPRP